MVVERNEIPTFSLLFGTTQKFKGFLWLRKSGQSFMTLQTVVWVLCLIIQEKGNSSQTWLITQLELTLNVQLDRLAESIPLWVACCANILAHSVPGDVLQHKRLIWNNDSFLWIIVKLIFIILCGLKDPLRLGWIFNATFLFSRSVKRGKKIWNRKANFLTLCLHATR